MGPVAAVILLFTTAGPPRVGMVPLSTQGFTEEQRTFYEDHLRRALLRFGLPVDSVDETRTLTGGNELDGCALKTPTGCRVESYAGIVVGELTSSDQGYSGQLAVVDPVSGGLLAAETFASSETRSFLDAVTAAADRIAQRTARRLNYDIPPDAPLRGAAVYPLVAGGALIATGAYFLASASSDSSTLKSSSVPLGEAVSARDSGPRNLTLGITLTTLGVASTIVGIVFYAPGAERKPLVRLSVDPVGQRVALSGALP